MSTVSDQIAEILKQRKSRLPQLEGILKRCAPIQQPLNEVDNMLDDLASQSSDNERLVYTCGKCRERIAGFRNDLNKLIQEVGVARTRFNRDTINIGFAGTKGTGKSFLLQKLSGLTDNEVPSADGMPVTAVRCNIKNSSENKAHVLFYDAQGFLENRVQPFCRELHINAPVTLEEFRRMQLPPSFESDKEEIYRQKLLDYQQALHEYEGLLTGTEQAIELADLRKYVSYTLPRADRPGGDPVHYYLAVSKVDINCTFPRTDVTSLQLIDLPGLGELDPSLESRHTDSFKDMVDLCLYVRRPSGTRMDWDQQAQKALDTLTDNCPLSRAKAADFILMVINAGGCNEENAIIMADETSQKLGTRYTILRTASSDSDGLSQDVLVKALNHLAKTLPENDAVIFSSLSDQFRSIQSGLEEFLTNAKRLLRQEGQGQDMQEITQQAARDAKRSFATQNRDVLNELERGAAGQEDPEALLAKLEQIEAELDEYFSNGMEKGSQEEWLKYARERIAEDNTPDKLRADSINAMRVHIAQNFSTTLDIVYAKYVSDLQQNAVDALNSPKVLNGLLNAQTPKENLELLLNYIDNSDLPIPNMRKAVKSLLNLKIEHNAQFYPRAYDPVRALKNAMRNRGGELDGNTEEQEADSLFRFLTSIGTYTVSEIKKTLVEEARRALYNILFVAYEMFDDYMIRHADSELEWNRLFKAYFDDIRQNERKVNKSYILNKAVKLLDNVREQIIQ